MSGGQVAARRCRVGGDAHVVARAERALAGAGEDGYAQVRIVLVHGPHVVELVGGGWVQGVADFGSVEGDREQVPVALQPAEVRHATGTGRPRFTPWAISRFCSVAM